MVNQIRPAILLLLIIISFCTCTRKIKREQKESFLQDSTKKEQTETYDIFNNATECKVLYDIRLTTYDKTDTLFFEKSKDIDLYIFKDSIYYNKDLIFCFGNVAAYEALTYLISEGGKYLYFYPGYFYDFSEPEEEPGVPAILKSWHNCGILIEFSNNGHYIIKKNLPYIDPTEYCSLYKISTFDLLEKDEICLNYNDIFARLGD